MHGTQTVNINRVLLHQSLLCTGPRLLILIGFYYINLYYARDRTVNINRVLLHQSLLCTGPGLLILIGFYYINLYYARDPDC